MVAFKILLTLGLASAVLADGRHGQGFGRNGRSSRNGIGRTGRQNSGQAVSIPGGVDFSNCQPQPDGTCCVIKETRVTSLQKDPMLECNHKNVEKCHYTYVTQFKPAQEEVCEENFEKKCQITFRQVAQRDKVQKCLTPLVKVCDEQQSQPQYGYGRPPPQPQYGQQSEAPEECRTFYESSCTTRYIEKTPGKFVGDTQCEKKPIKLCGQGCRMEQGPEECHDKEIDVLVDVPEEVCDLNPQKTCRFQTKLVPSLKPEHECTIVPQEVCNLRFSPPKSVDKPLKTRWCIDPNAQVERGESYDEAQAAAEPIRDYGAAASAPQSYAQPAPPTPSYSQPPAPAPQGYGQPAPTPVYQEPAPAAPAPAPQGYGSPEPAPAPQGYGSPAPAPQGYGSPEPAPAPQGYGSPEPAPAPQGYGSPEPAPAPQGYGSPEPAPQGYGSPAPAPAPQGYGSPEPAQPAYGQPEPPQPSYGQPAPAPAPQGYGSPQPAQPAYGQPAPAPAPQPSYGQAPSPAQPPAPGPIYYKPAPEAPAPPSYGRRFYYKQY